MFDDCIPLSDKLSIRRAEPLYKVPKELLSLKLPANNIYNNFNWSDVEMSFISKDYENFHNIWRFDGLVPESSKRFYNEFPRVGSDWDGEHHIYSDYSFIMRWFPAFSQNLSVAGWLYPELNNAPKYLAESPHPDLLPRANVDRNLHHNLDKAKVFNANPVPTKFERNLCEGVNGSGLYNRKGKWSCYIIKGNVLDLEYDEYGPKFFMDFGDWLKWKKLMKKKIVEAVEKDHEDEAVLLRKISYSD